VKGLVIINGSDPGQQSSATEQDNRFYAPFMHYPILQPSSVQEAKDFVVQAFDLSDRFTLPFIIDAPSMLLHGSGELELGVLPDTFPATGTFKPYFEPTIHDVNLGRPGRHKVLLIREEEVRAYAGSSELNRVIEGNAKWGIISSGMAFGYTMEALEILGLKDVPVLKLGGFMKGLEKVVIVEEGDGFLEQQVKILAYDLGLRVPVVGKEWFSAVGMLSPSRVAIDLSKGLKLPLPNQYKNLPAKFIEETEKLASSLAFPGGGSIPMPLFEAPRRVRTFCSGCPHRATAFAIKRATKGKLVIGVDIGCYAMMEGPPFNLGDYKICMGAGIGVAQGISRKVNDIPVLAVIGDSTLLHAGLPAVLNAAYYDANVLLVVVDNRWVAMTGHQPTPSTEETTDGKPVKNIDITELLIGLGVKWVRKVNPFELSETEKTIKDALKESGFKAVVAEGECAIQSVRRDNKLKVKQEKNYQIDVEKCKMCDVCYVDFGCPAIVMRRPEKGENFYAIDEGLCTQCGACAYVCKSEAITSNSGGTGIR
jgi:indolepyruvate ferredoxin oxidoreductase alpha subunit